MFRVITILISLGSLIYGIFTLIENRGIEKLNKRINFANQFITINNTYEEKIAECVSLHEAVLTGEYNENAVERQEALRWFEHCGSLGKPLNDEFDDLISSGNPKKFSDEKITFVESFRSIVTNFSALIEVFRNSHNKLESYSDQSDLFEAEWFRNRDEMDSAVSEIVESQNTFDKIHEIFLEP